MPEEGWLPHHARRHRASPTRCTRRPARPASVARHLGPRQGVSYTRRTRPLIRYSRYGYADLSADRHRRDRQCDGLRGRRHPDARHRVLQRAFDFFGAVAVPRWLTSSRPSHAVGQGGEVGMMGISYGGISQCHHADPPATLAAISLLSVIPTPPRRNALPWGNLSTGFAVAWAQERASRRRPAGTGAQAQVLPSSGSRTATRRSGEPGSLHGEAASLMEAIRAISHCRSEGRDPLDPVSFVPRSTCPPSPYQFQDEQTRWPHPALVRRYFTGTKARSGSRSPTAPTSTLWFRRRSTALMTSSSSTVAHRRRASESASRSGPLRQDLPGGPRHSPPTDPDHCRSTTRPAAADLADAGG